MIAVAAQPSVVFPSRDFFAALQARMNERAERYRELGPLDLRLCLRVQPDERWDIEEVYGLSFFEDHCDKVDEVCCPPEFGADATLEGPYGAWRELLENILTNGRAEADHTLEALIDRRSRLRIAGEDAERARRHLAALQRFLEECAGLGVEFAG